VTCRLEENLPPPCADQYPKALSIILFDVFTASITFIHVTNKREAYEKKGLKKTGSKGFLVRPGRGVQEVSLKISVFWKPLKGINYPRIVR